MTFFSTFWFLTKNSHMFKLESSWVKLHREEHHRICLWQDLTTWSWSLRYVVVHSSIWPRLGLLTLHWLPLRREFSAWVQHRQYMPRRRAKSHTYCSIEGIVFHFLYFFKGRLSLIHFFFFFLPKHTLFLGWFLFPLFLLQLNHYIPWITFNYLSVSLPWKLSLLEFSLLVLSFKTK